MTSVPTTLGTFITDVDFRLIAESIPHIVWMAAPDGSTVYFNKQGTAYTGQPSEANYGWDWVSLIHPDDLEQTRIVWEHAIQTQTPFHIDYRIRRFDGTFRPKLRPSE